MVSGRLFYYLVLRPMEYFRSRKKEKRNSTPDKKPL